MSLFRWNPDSLPPLDRDMENELDEQIREDADLDLYDDGLPYGGDDANTDLNMRNGYSG